MRVAIELAVPVMRTAGFFQNKLIGKDAPFTTRLLAGVTSGFPTYVNPFFIAFLSGFAYENDEEVAEGWLSAFGKILLSPVVETDLEQMLRGAATGNFFEFMDALAEWTSEATGLETLAAFFRGIAEASSDFEKLTGVGLPTNWLAEFIIWLNATLTGSFDMPFPWPGDPPPLPPDVEPFVGHELWSTTKGRGAPITIARRTLTAAPGPEGQPIVTAPGTVGLLERGAVATADLAYFISNLSFKGPRPNLWGILQDAIPPDVREKFLWLLQGGGASAKQILGGGGGGTNGPSGGGGVGGGTYFPI